MKRGHILQLWKDKGGTIIGPDVNVLHIPIEQFWDFLLEFEEQRGMELLDEIADIRQHRQQIEKQVRRGFKD